jgi:hypothetical protein
MKTVTFKDYHRFLLNNPHLKDHITEGTEICACQWVDAENVVQAQAVYQKFLPSKLVSKTYQIRED